MTTPLPVVALIVYPNFSPFHFSVPYLVFNAEVAEGRLFDLKIVSPGARSLAAERAMTVHPDGGLELADLADIVVVPGWHDLDTPPEPELGAALARAHARGAHVVGLCYGAYVIAYAGLLDGKRASTHWMAERDFSQRFPRVKLDMNALYVDEDRLITSAGTGAGLDCCLYLVRAYYGPKIANKVARTMVIPPHREGGQAQFIEQPVAASTEDSRVNRLLDYLRANLGKQHSIDELAARAATSRRTFTRHFQKATGMTLGDWLVNERLQQSRELLETTSIPVERISELAGFQTPLSLRQHFKKRFHVSPRDWRRTFGPKSTAEQG
ncbi:GlxA family transcriptional regulator [Pseudoduganella chitinolytica]|uniref:Helix-turn-helix domain-containing protein n=1 Tax=Pseudoduganella chitinolytica TaxID=34070 RepID=A0ABY8BCC5_9BURK|nr:helix-turn-helix domain-containing protein [Pseudoduganella chitinolytica]WEF33557.1 helix-turn-helix domain-containing protein [Pseudoduganella chitinolytica]